MGFRRSLLKTGISILSVILALLFGAFLILIVNKNPITTYGFLFKGAFGSPHSIGETLVKATPLLMTGLAAVFSYQCGMFNLGAEGQFIMGAIACNWFSTKITALEGFPNILISIILGAVAGGIWGAIPGLLKAWRNLNEMIISILLNYIATFFMAYLYAGPLMEANIPQTAAVAQVNRLTRFMPPTRVHTGLFIGLATVILVYYFLYYTAKGYQMRAVGYNPIASRVNGLPVKRLMVMSFVISGAIAGLGGAIEVLGVSFRLMSGFAAGFGFDGVAIALIGQLNPIGTAFIAYLFAILRVGANTMQVGAGIPTAIVDIIQAVIIIFAIAASAYVALPGFQRVLAKFEMKEG